MRMGKEIIRESDKNIMYHRTGVTKFTGCQCQNDCTCHEDFTPKEYSYYQVKRKNIKTTNHATIEEAEARWNFVESL
jgi:hypothetical protein